jgi:fibronectin-binding autotransporter adhesin
MKKRIAFFIALCGLSGIVGAVDLPQPAVYFPLDSSLLPSVGDMPVAGTATYDTGMSGFGLACTTSANALRAPLGYNDAMEPGTGDWTLSFWARFNKDTFTTNIRLFSKGGRDDNSAAGSPGYQLFMRPGNKTCTLFFTRRNVTTREKLDMNQFFTNFVSMAWNHVVITRRSALLRVYLNGVFTAEKTLAGGATGDYGVQSPSSNTATCTQLSPEQATPGWGLDDVATWKTSLTDDQIAFIYAQGRLGKPLSALAESTAAFVTETDGEWNNAETWSTMPTNGVNATILHDLTAVGTLPTLDDLIIWEGSLELETGSSIHLSTLSAVRDVTAITNLDSAITVDGAVSFAYDLTNTTYYLQSGVNASLHCGNLSLGMGQGSTTEFTQLGGSTEITNELVLASASSGSTATFTLTDGTLTTAGINFGYSTGGTLIFDGGTLVIPEAARNPFVHGMGTITFSESKNAIIDTDGHNVTFLPFYTPQGTGSLVKRGTGTLRISGTYSGATTVEAGTLNLYGDTLSTTNFTVAEGATLQIDGGSTVAGLTLNGTLAFGATANGLGLANINTTGYVVTLGENAAVSFPGATDLVPGGSYDFLTTDNANLGDLALSASCPAGWCVTQNGTTYTLKEITTGTVPLSRTDIVARLSHETICALTQGTTVYTVGAFAGTGVVISNAYRNDLGELVPGIYFNGGNTQAMHGPRVPTVITGNNTWSASMWVWSDNRVNHEPSVLCWGLRCGHNKENCSLNHGSNESRAASFFGDDPKYTAGAPALDSWQHIVFSYNGATTGQGLSVYVNGEPATLSLNVNALIIPDDGQSIMLGNQHEYHPDNVLARPYLGLIGELVIYRSPLTADEALALYNLGKTTYIGSDVLPDAGQIFQTTAVNKWTNETGWVNGHVPFGNNPLVTGSGVLAALDSDIPSFKSLSIDSGATVQVSGGVKFAPGNNVAISNNATLRITDGSTLDPSGYVYIGSNGKLEINDSTLMLTALNKPLQVGIDDEKTDNTVSLNNSTGVIEMGDLLIGAHTVSYTTGGGILAMTNSTFIIGRNVQSHTFQIGTRTGHSELLMSNSVIRIYPNTTENISYIGASFGAGGATASVILDNSFLDMNYSRLFFAYDGNNTAYVSSCRVNPFIVRNHSCISCPREFIVGRRNAAYYSNNALVANDPTVMILDNSTMTNSHWATIGHENGLASLIMTNNAYIFKNATNHFRIGTDNTTGNTAGAATAAFSGGTLHISTGSILEMDTKLNELRIAAHTNDRGWLYLDDDGIIKAFTVTGLGKTGVFEFNGGTLMAKGSTSDFMPCAVPVTTVAGKAAKIDSAAFDVTLQHIITGEGGLQKLGSGTLRLTPANTYTGLTTVEAGTLNLAEDSSLASEVTLPAGGGILTIGMETNNATASLPSLRLERNCPVKLSAKNVCSKFTFTTTDALIAAAGCGIELSYDTADAENIFAADAKYVLATAPSGASLTFPVVNLPRSWYVLAEDKDGIVTYTLAKREGTRCILK